MRDVQNSQARPRVPVNAFKSAPLVVMNSFGGEEHMRLATTMFQHLFPSINVQVGGGAAPAGLPCRRQRALRRQGLAPASPRRARHSDKRTALAGQLPHSTP
jgi:hypothetical protein